MVTLCKTSLSRRAVFMVNKDLPWSGLRDIIDQNCLHIGALWNRSILSARQMTSSLLQALGLLQSPICPVC